jgi:hypothetical protein
VQGSEAVRGYPPFFIDPEAGIETVCGREAAAALSTNCTINQGSIHQ